MCRGWVTVGARRPVRGGLGSRPRAATPPAHGSGATVRSPRGNNAEAQPPRARSLRGGSGRRRHTGSAPSACRAGRRGSRGRGGAAGPLPLPLPSPRGRARAGRGRPPFRGAVAAAASPAASLPALPAPPWLWVTLLQLQLAGSRGSGRPSAPGPPAPPCCRHEGRGRRRPGALLQPGQGPGAAGPAALPRGGLALLLPGLRLRAHGQRAGQPLRVLLRQVGRRRGRAGGRRGQAGGGAAAAARTAAGGSARGAQGPSAGGWGGGRAGCALSPLSPRAGRATCAGTEPPRARRTPCTAHLPSCSRRWTPPGVRGSRPRHGRRARLVPTPGTRCSLGALVARPQVLAATAAHLEPVLPAVCSVLPSPPARPAAADLPFPPGNLMTLNISCKVRGSSSSFSLGTCVWREVRGVLTVQPQPLLGCADGTHRALAWDFENVVSEGIRQNVW